MKLVRTLLNLLKNSNLAKIRILKEDNPLEFLSGDYSGFVKSIAQIGQKMGYRPKISRRSFWAGHPAASLPKNVRF